MEAAFGEVLKEWRGVRRMSQLDLGLAANVSARHISFLETGRARPSQPMVMQLAETLDMPRPERNRLLNAAGYRAAYSARKFDDADMAPVNAAIDLIVSRHDPYPAFVLDRHWRLISANASGTMVMASFGIGTGDSMLDAMTEPGRGAAMIENWSEVAAHMLTRLERVLFSWKQSEWMNFSHLTRRRPQSDAVASVEDFDDVRAEKTPPAVR
jgi:transcriptional regulator with XRE-family HTH domain